MKQKGTVLIVVLLVMVLIGIGIDIAITIKAMSSIPTKPSLPCAAIPTRFVMEYPECADRLLQAMNVSNVRFRSHANLSRLSNYQIDTDLEGIPK